MTIIVVGVVCRVVRVGWPRLRLMYGWPTRTRDGKMEDGIDDRGWTGSGCGRESGVHLSCPRKKRRRVVCKRGNGRRVTYTWLAGGGYVGSKKRQEDSNEVGRRGWIGAMEAFVDDCIVWAGYVREEKDGGDCFTLGDRHGGRAERLRGTFFAGSMECGGAMTDVASKLIGKVVVEQQWWVVGKRRKNSRGFLCVRKTGYPYRAIGNYWLSRQQPVYCARRGKWSGGLNGELKKLVPSIRLYSKRGRVQSKSSPVPGSTEFQEFQLPKIKVPSSWLAAGIQRWSWVTLFFSSCTIFPVVGWPDLQLLVNISVTLLCLVTPGRQGRRANAWDILGNRDGNRTLVCLLQAELNEPDDLCWDESIRSHTKEKVETKKRERNTFKLADKGIPNTEAKRNRTTFTHIDFVCLPCTESSPSLLSLYCCSFFPISSLAATQDKPSGQAPELDHHLSMTHSNMQAQGEKGTRFGGITSPPADSPGAWTSSAAPPPPSSWHQQRLKLRILTSCFLPPILPLPSPPPSRSRSWFLSNVSTYLSRPFLLPIIPCKTTRFSCAACIRRVSNFWYFPAIQRGGRKEQDKDEMRREGRGGEGRKAEGEDTMLRTFRVTLSILVLRMVPFLPFNGSRFVDVASPLAVALESRKVITTLTDHSPPHTTNGPKGQGRANREKKIGVIHSFGALSPRPCEHVVEDGLKKWRGEAVFWLPHGKLRYAAAGWRRRSHRSLRNGPDGINRNTRDTRVLTEPQSVGFVQVGIPRYEYAIKPAARERVHADGEMSSGIAAFGREGHWYLAPPDMDPRTVKPALILGGCLIYQDGLGSRPKEGCVVGPSPAGLVPAWDSGSLEISLSPLKRISTRSRRLIALLFPGMYSVRAPRRAAVQKRTTYTTWGRNGNNDDEIQIMRRTNAKLQRPDQNSGSSL
ncbi:hypothetical protein CCUS01_09080 [Colletotrichum cuscutae]|uniref:Uncharacterized protein n=1 Tax=Colletotrichum cuscutae TaxID=1209917 RepID=A0AAI9XPN9_9PEZI|nr:hypothetical protein CCUS01_09080 [Colletotrichum cuscutae]